LLELLAQDWTPLFYTGGVSIQPSRNDKIGAFLPASGRGSRGTFAGTGLSLPASRRVVGIELRMVFTQDTFYQRYDIEATKGMPASKAPRAAH
jgi:hypothetical protein